MHSTRLLLSIALGALVIAACGAAAPTGGATPAPSAAEPAATAIPSESPAASSSAGTAPSVASGGPREIVIDTDLAADDILAILALLRDDRVDVRAITIAGTGEVHCSAGLPNARRLLAAMGETGIPVACGREDPGPNGRWFPPEWRAGADALYGVGLPAVPGQAERGEPAAQLLTRLAAERPEALTVVALGPWTNLQDAAALDPAFAANLAGIHAMAGTIDAPGNIDYGETSPADGVEWNVGADPDAVGAVLGLDVPITLVPLDATNDVPVPAGFADLLGTDHAAAGADIAYEIYLRNPFLTQGSSFWDTLAAVLLGEPGIATWEDLTARMEPSGTGAGHLVRDPAGRPVRAAMSADREAFMVAFLAALRTGAPRAEPFTMSGTLTVHWDGTTCEIDGPAPTTAGGVKAEIVNASDAVAGVVVGGVRPPKAWADAVALVQTLDLSDPNLALPDWVVEVGANLSAPAGETASTLIVLPTGTFGVLCATGDWPTLEFFDGGSFEVGG